MNVQKNEPIFNVPAAIQVTCLVLICVHAVRFFLPDEIDFLVVYTFAFVPARYFPPENFPYEFPLGFFADVWTIVSYTFLHGDWMHLFINCFWLLAFGSALAWRFSMVRFVAFSLVCSAAGAVFHLMAHVGDVQPMIGASAAISGHMAAVSLFMFQAGGPFSQYARKNPMAFKVPALSILEASRSPQVLIFLGIWLLINFFFGTFGSAMAGEGQSIAWQAHLGGFLAGLLLFRYFDPVPRVTWPTPNL